MKITQANIQDVFKSTKMSRETMELKGYKMVEEFFVDNSGFGADDEPALRPNRFMEELTNTIKEHGQVTTTITNAGQFQVDIGVFVKNGKSKAKRIENNTYEIINDDGSRAIRLHDTDIITFTNKGTIILSSGGWQTKTTKDRLNKYLPDNIRINQKNYNWTVNIHGVKQEFTEGMEIIL